VSVLTMLSAWLLRPVAVTHMLCSDMSQDLFPLMVITCLNGRPPSMSEQAVLTCNVTVNLVLAM